jgi:transposase, IS5 family
LRILRSRLGRIIRDIRRKIEGQPALEEAFVSGGCILLKSGV